MALRHSLSATQDSIFGAAILVGLALRFAPKMSADIDLAGWAADLSGWKIAGGVLGTIVGLRLLLAPFWLHKEMEEKLQKAESLDARDRFAVEGGQGGEAAASGAGGLAEACGGIGAAHGSRYAGAGGGAHARGEVAYAKGGTGGNLATPDGRGGQGARGPMEARGRPTHLWNLGRAGSGGNQPEYNRRLAILDQIFIDYFAAFPERAPYVRLGIDLMPVDWVSARLSEMNEAWRVTQANGRLILPPLT